MRSYWICVISDSSFLIRHASRFFHSLRNANSDQDRDGCVKTNSMCLMSKTFKMSRFALKINIPLNRVDASYYLHSGQQGGTSERGGCPPSGEPRFKSVPASCAQESLTSDLCMAESKEK